MMLLSEFPFKRDEGYDEYSFIVNMRIHFGKRNVYKQKWNNLTVTSLPRLITEAHLNPSLIGQSFPAHGVSCTFREPFVSQFPLCRETQDLDIQCVLPHFI